MNDGPFRDERDVIIEKLREELQEAKKDACTKLARMAVAKKVEPTGPRWWTMLCTVVGVVLAPPVAILVATGIATGLHYVFVRLAGGEGTGGPWASAIVLTVVGCGLSGLVLWFLLDEWSRDKQR